MRPFELLERQCGAPNSDYEADKEGEKDFFVFGMNFFPCVHTWKCNIPLDIILIYPWYPPQVPTLRRLMISKLLLQISGTAVQMHFRTTTSCQCNLRVTLRCYSRIYLMFRNSDVTNLYWYTYRYLWAIAHVDDC